MIIAKCERDPPSQWHGWFGWRLAMVAIEPMLPQHRVGMLLSTPALLRPADPTRQWNFCLGAWWPVGVGPGMLGKKFASWRSTFLLPSERVR